MGKPIIEKLLIKSHSKKERKTLPKKTIVKHLNLIDLVEATSCKVIVLENINELARKYRGKLNLSLKLTKKSNHAIDPILNTKLVRWEMELNKICIKDPVIAVENFVDNEGPPKDFNYVRENINNPQSDDLLDPSFLVGCECYPRCSHSNCECPKNSGGHFAYDRSKRVLLPKGSPIYECNKSCKCEIDCPNRVIQKGLTTRVCIFRTPNGRGWGLKTREFIPKNKFVVEYVGEIITSDDAEQRGKEYDSKQQTYLFDLDFNDEDATFTVDAYRYGNVSHFINHSCDPNLRVYSVWVNTLDPRLPRIALFATRDIQAGEELTFDYLMTCNDEEPSPTSKSKKYSKKSMKKEDEREAKERVYCACGAKNCRKYLF